MTVCAGGHLASAEDQDTLIRQGIELRKHGQGQEALAVFQKAAEIKKSPLVMAQLALAEQALGMWVRAEAHLKAALEGERDPWIIKNRRVIDGSLTTIQSHLGSLEVWGSPPGAEVIIDGQSVGTLPLAGTIRIPLGESSITVRREGYAEITRVVKISHGSSASENVDLHLLSPRPRLVLQPAPESGTSAGVTTVATERRALASESDARGQSADRGRPFYKRWWFWTLVGAVAVGGGTGYYLYTHRSDTLTNGCTEPNPVNCGMF